MLSLILLLALAAPAQEVARPADPAPPPKKEEKRERRISDKEARALFKEVDEILKFVSKETGLAIKHPVKRELTTREKLREFVRRSRDDDSVRRLERAEIVLKKLGLLPRDFRLEQYLDEMLEEQVAGYYDPRTKTIYLLDWLQADTQRPVLAHELTHALQDQHFDLEQFLRKAQKREDQSSALQSDAAEVRVAPDEPATARHAMIEGQGMVVLLNYMLAPSGRSLSDSPMVGEFMKAAAQRQAEDSPRFSGAPLYLRDSITFSYLYGLDFVEAALRKGGKQLAFTGVMKEPPRNTREVMEPKVYLEKKEDLAPLYLPNMRRVLGKDYDPYDVGNFGQFDTRTLLKQYAGDKAADKLATHWRGGAYYSAERTAGTAGKTDCSARPEDAAQRSAQRVACLGLLLLTRWSSSERAAEFAQRYAALLLAKYRFAQSLTADERPSGARGERSRCFDCPGGERWNTDEGLVSIQQRGDYVLVLESWDDALLATLPDDVFSRQKPAPSAPAATNATTGHRPPDY